MDVNSIPLLFLIALGLFLSGEIAAYALIVLVNKRFAKRRQKGFLLSSDELPSISRNELEKFIEHGFDPELGWVRKPNTSKSETGEVAPVTYHIDQKGIRVNPGHEQLEPAISVYGDSFSFCRQVEDNETWPWFLSQFTHTNVLNFGVGNYGCDQALLRLKREFPRNRTKITILGVVPMTIGRIVNVWAHYREPGNIFGFKPRFILENGSLKLFKNIIDQKEKFFELEKYLPEIQKHDFFFKNVFKKQIVKFPFQWHLLRVYYRDFPLAFSYILERVFEFFHFKSDRINRFVGELNLKRKLGKYYAFFNQEELIVLWVEILKEFASYSRHLGSTPVFILLPRLQDLLFIKKSNHLFYKPFVDRIQGELLFLDLSESFLSLNNVKELFVSDRYGGHYNKKGNKLVAQALHEFLHTNQVI